MSSFISRKTEEFKSIFKQGLTPEDLALSFTLGIIGGIFPIPGVTTFVCLLFIYLFKLNPVATQFVNFVLTPVDIALVVPFMQLGYLITQRESQISSDIFTNLKEDFFGSLSVYWEALLHGIIAWIVLSPLLGFVLYKVILVLTKKFVRTKKRE
eukprot:TRINITY_DN13832_c0_g1_i1.p1 TRINITY_DN13832_c0_g1~~TRINITY_DN13832_c0_g1_i1.p1  ORF type:complete len:161 (+),score=20.53 TRINITY_DN13832_c0_g1_i1:23-484(+)